MITTFVTDDSSTAFLHKQYNQVKFFEDLGNNSIKKQINFLGIDD